MFGLNNALRSTFTSAASVIDNAGRTIVGGTTLLERAVNRRLDEEVQAAKTAQLRAESVKDLAETAKSLGYTGTSTQELVTNMVTETDQILASLRK